ncbi:MAG: DAK2 domain-containing protein [Eubacteriales bacterium]
MALSTIDAKMLIKMFLAGAKNLEYKKEWINELNVFPVPDGDTGTNMSLTIMAACKEVVAAGEEAQMADIAKAISMGSLRGARGNSGVILSQLFRGFTKELKEVEEITIEDLAIAMNSAVETAYKAVMKPKEGTILTVAKGAAEKMQELVAEGRIDLEAVFQEVLEHTEYVLSQTPEMLPVLKQAGVVDSGGQGLLEVLQGAYDAFLGKEVDYSSSFEFDLTTAVSQGGGDVHPVGEDIKFGYCTEFIILTEKEISQNKEMQLKTFLESIGDSIVVVADDEVVKVHVHTNDPGLAIQKALKIGQLTNLKIDNMRLENLEKIKKQEEKVALEKKKIGFIAVSIGEGMNEIFKQLGVDYLIEGGQTMNPSTEDMMKAIEQVNAETVFILPNNKNIILAANQVKSLVEDKEVIVIPTTTVPQGITAIINVIADLSPQENEATILEEISRVKTGQVTYAVRDTIIDDIAIKQNDYMGIGDKGILSVGTDLKAITFELVEKMIEESSELISIYYGAEVSKEDAQAMQDKIQKTYKRCDVELQYGGQPIYYYVISVE